MDSDEDDSPIIGIDLGTTYSVAAVHKNGKTITIPDRRGHRLIPSCVYYNPESDSVIVGSEANEPIYAGNSIWGIKRIIGRKYDDAYVQDLAKNQMFQSELIHGENGKVAIQISHNDAFVLKSPEQISSNILTYLRQSAIEYLGVDVQNAIISIPARFSNAQREATLEAARLAGLNVLKLITEPVAAAIHYSEDMECNGTLLIFDLGGGTLDISVVHVQEKKFSVKAIEGNTSLGGSDFDYILFQYIKKQLNEKYGVTEFTAKTIHSLKRKAIKAKCELSFQENYVALLPLPNAKGKLENFEVSISRTTFENLIKNLLNDILALVDKCIQEAGLIRENISDVVLVGGSTRIPKLQEVIGNFFNKKPKWNLNPDEAVALGAAIQGAVLKKTFHQFEKFEVTDISPFFLGYAVLFNRFEIAIKKHCPIPYKSAPIKNETFCNDQKYVEIAVYEGHRKNCKYNNLLGLLKIENLPPGRAGDIKIETTFFLNRDGILEVEAWETTTKNKKKLTVNYLPFGLCEYKVNHGISDAFAHRQEDDNFHIEADYKSAVEKMCQTLLYDIKIGKPSHITYYIYFYYARYQISKQCRQIQLFINRGDVGISAIREQYINFRERLLPLIKNASGIIKGVFKSDQDIFADVSDAVKEYNKLFYLRPTNQGNSYS